ncbi:MAG: cation transporter [Oscillatoriales cyanobacterium]|jgi:cation diffusion facilitator family transporter|nr:MAG: cation transporter [Oscillatoriales cyanobacterium]
MPDCCDHGHDLDELVRQQRKVLWAVLIVNAIMFGVELVSGLRSRSLALTGDSLDMLGDALAYGTSLYVLDRGDRAQARAALLKSGLMFLSAIIIFGRALYQLWHPDLPTPSVMGAIALLALIANIFCLLVLTRHRDDNLNLQSVWLCSRNDLINNSSVIVAAAFVALFSSPWPDIVVGLFVTLIVARSAGRVLRQAWDRA